MAVDYLTTDTEITSIADAIRAKTGGTATLSYPTEFVSAIGTLRNPSGNIQLTQATSTNIADYATATVRAVTGSIGGSASSGSAAAAIANTNNMATITDLSGKTAGTDYWQVKATATGTAGSYTPKYTVNTAGWIGATVTGTAQSVSVSGDSTGKSIYIPKAGISNSGGGLSNTTNYNGTPTVSLSLDSQSTSGIAITDTVQSSGYYVKLTGSTAAMSGSTKVTRADYKETRTAGYCPAMAEKTILASATSSPTVTVNAASKTRYLTLPTATFAVSGNKVYCNSRGWVPTGSASSAVGAIAEGTITNNTSGGTSSGTINRGSQIKIGAGYYSSDKYYTAQANSGTKTVIQSGTTSVDGYANVSVPKIAIVVNVTATSSTSKTINDSNITADHYVYNQASTVPSADVSWSTSAGSLTLSCSAGIPAMTLMLCRDM